MEEKENVMTEDLAMKEIERWADDKDIDIYVTDGNGKKILDTSIPRLLKEIQRGNLYLNDDCDFVYIISKKSPAGYAGEKITLKNPTGAAYMAMDKFKEQEGVHKTIAVASAITGQDVRWFSNIANNDYKVVSIIVGFFIAG